MTTAKVAQPVFVSLSFDKRGGTCGAARIEGFVKMLEGRLQLFNELVAKIGQADWTESVKVQGDDLVVTYSFGVLKRQVRAGLHDITKRYGVFVASANA